MKKIPYGPLPSLRVCALHAMHYANLRAFPSFAANDEMQNAVRACVCGTQTGAETVASKSGVNRWSLMSGFVANDTGLRGETPRERLFR